MHGLYHMRYVLTIMIRAVIFDLDGTLLDTLEDLADAMNSVLRGRRLPIHPPAAYRRFIGEGVAKLVERALPENARQDSSIREGVAGMREAYAAMWNRKSRPYPGVPELLEDLKSRGVPMAVLSNKPHSFTRKVVDAYFGMERFEFVLGEKHGRRKPDPAGALEIGASMGFAAGEICFLGDSGTDMETAGRAGMYPVGALWGYRTKEELEESGAEILLSRPAELIGIFRSRTRSNT